MLHRELLLLLGEFEWLDLEEQMTSVEQHRASAGTWAECGAQSLELLQLDEHVALEVEHQGSDRVLYKLPMSSVLRDAEVCARSALLPHLVPHLSHVVMSSSGRLPAHVWVLLSRALDPSRLDELAKNVDETTLYELILYMLSEGRSDVRRGVRHLVMSALRAAPAYCDVLSSSATRYTGGGQELLLEMLVEVVREDNGLSERHLPGLVGALLRADRSAPVVLSGAVAALGDKLTLYDAGQRRRMAGDALRAALKHTSPEKHRACVTLAAALLRGQSVADVVDEVLTVEGEAAAAGARALLQQLGLVCGVPEVHALLHLRDGALCDTLLTPLDLRHATHDDLDALFHFVETFADLLMEIRQKETIRLLCRTIEGLSCAQLASLETRLAVCVRVAGAGWRDVTAELANALRRWSAAVPFDAITESLERGEVSSEQVLMLRALRSLRAAWDEAKQSGVECDDVVRAEVAHRWAWSCVHAHSSGHEPAPSVHDALYVACSALQDDEFVDLVTQAGVEFCRAHLDACAARLCDVSAALVRRQPALCCHLLPDIVHVVGDIDPGHSDVRIVRLLDAVWSEYERNSSLEQRTRVVRASRGAGAAVLYNWPLTTLQDESVALCERVRLLPLVPALTEHESLRRSVARSAALAVGSRLSEARGAAAATYCALLEALVDQHVLEVVTTLVDEELERGWWDSALESSCVVMADGQGGTEALQRVFAICWSGRTTAVVERMLLPMLRWVVPRYSPRAQCCTRDWLATGARR
ncbi:uncharacterized protein LOC126967694 [Leptidea sinapis]|uniref:uncharacterized protein LOC126967694 n=1 Tax=Leptidea sinapis TaxID=189913 RepID=UPI0021C3B05B|nr:uncharacterized protein LOC126967694 [Leptidea sinapis]